MKISSIFKKCAQRYADFGKHPLTRDNRLAALGRYVSFNLTQTIAPKSRIYPWVEVLKFYGSRGEAGIVPNVYYKLFDFDESKFVMRNLKEGELFVDVGANVGHYSLLAAGVAKARVMAIEPIPETYEKLSANVGLNSLGDRVDCLNIGVGESTGTLKFVQDRSVLSRVALEGETDTLEIPVKTLDHLVGDENPVFLKIDVEGFEYSVLKGAAAVLRKPSLRYLMIEFNDSGSRFGHSDEEVFAIVRDRGFVPISYDGGSGRIVAQESFNTDRFNTLFIREELVESHAEAVH